jgi:hypothetical protein
MNKAALKIATLLILLIAPSIVSASKFLNPKSPGFEIDTVYNDDVYISGSMIKFDSKVYGDLFTFSYEMVQSDSILGNFMAFAYSVQNLGPVTGSLRAFGKTLSCNSSVGRNLLFFGQDINVGPQATIGKNAELKGDNIVFQGAVEGDLKIKGHIAFVSGNINGDLNFAGDSLNINPGTQIRGNLNYTSAQRAVIGDATVIGGQTNWNKPEIEKPVPKSKGGFWQALTWIISLKGYLIISILLYGLVLAGAIIHFPSWFLIIFLWIVLMVSGNILIWIAKPQARATEQILVQKLFPSMGLGFIVFFLAPILALILFFIGLTAPLGLILLIVFGVAVFCAGIFASLHAGRRICGIFNPASKSTPGYLCYSIGMTVILLLSHIPYLGYLFMLVVFMSGLGGLIQAAWPLMRGKSAPNAEAQVTKTL